MSNSTTSPESPAPQVTTFRSPIRAGVAVLLILIGLGQISGRIFSINAVNMLSLEQVLRNDLLDELKYLAVVAREESNAEDLAIYEETLRREFRFDPKVLEGDAAAKAAKASKEKAPRKWPIQSRRDNWDSRQKTITTEALVKKVVGETKYRQEDLVAELRWLALEALESNKPEDLAVYLRALENLNPVPSNDQVVSTVVPLTEEQLRAPEIAESIRAVKQQAKHHWPIELRKRDAQRIAELYSTQAIVDMVLKETNKQRPFLSGNDRSRWLTVRSLVEHGTFEVNSILEYEPAWDSVDIVSHMNAQGEQKLYSSKPPLQATLIAAPYWVLHKMTGWTLGDHPFELGRILLFIVNVVPLGIGWWCCARLLDAWCDEDLTFVVIMAGICFATLLSTFHVAINNHTWGAISAAAASWYASKCWRGSQAWSDFAWVGFWSAFTFACELPAASLVGMFGLLLLWRAPQLTLLVGTPAVVLVLFAYFGTNYVAHGRWSPPYSFGAGDVNTADSKTKENWYDYDFIRLFDGKKVDSYWRRPDNPLDLGEKDLGKYVFHATLGHHGILSLTPLLALAIPGLLVTCWSARRDQQLWGISLLAVSAACIVFYLFMLDTRQRNYGGTTSAFRQLLWLHPLWLIASAPVASRLLQRKWGIALVGALGFLSALAATYPHWNPWSQTWIWNWMQWNGIPPI
ncbi:hypothetical protein VN12_14120 [Pirellula sp. SH-Sr6A]|uniref:hypothetical protein n=1 Tax=Pirellula sp. SH-Sr6A TaxID=1632865 RepID=UPI00078E86DC|nr:hypothetical protein [Pirellula sp. SH-Sr6A]AMV33259.1 hypothetical protein VN12_14120 [Pirellula sp. SH-Sr6A]